MLTRVILVTSWLALLALVLAAHLAAGGRLEHADAPARPQAGALPAVVTASSPEAPAQLDMRRQLARLVAAIPRDSRYGTATATQLARELSGARPFLLDVREPAERQTDGYVEGSVSIPLRRLMASLDQLPARDRAIVVYCASGHRGAMAMTALRLLGYTNVRNLAFGFGAWWKAGLPVAEDSAPAGPAVGTAPAIESPALHRMLGEYFAQMPSDFHATTAAALHADLSAGKRLVLVDVRRPEQYDKDGHIAGAVSVPFEVLFDNLDRLPSRDTPTLVYCASGHRSAVAVMGLRLLGYTDATSLDGGVDGWRAAGLPLGAGGAR